MTLNKTGVFALSIVLAFTAGVAAKTAMEGPKKAKNLTIETLGEFSLAKEIPDLDGRNMRMRKATIAPGGIVPVHSHAGRPGLAYVVNGEIIEHRDDRDEPVVHRSGSFAIESNGVDHWWENKGSEPVVAIVVDVYKN